MRLHLRLSISLARPASSIKAQYVALSLAQDVTSHSIRRAQGLYETTEANACHAPPRRLRSLLVGGGG